MSGLSEHVPSTPVASGGGGPASSDKGDDKPSTPTQPKTPEPEPTPEPTPQPVETNPSNAPVISGSDGAVPPARKPQPGRKPQRPNQPTRPQEKP